MSDELFDGEEITLEEILDAREKRVSMQQKILETYPNSSLLVATMNIPGSIKNSIGLMAIFVEAVAYIEHQLADVVPNVRICHSKKTGAEYYLSVNLLPEKLKKKMIQIEETYKYGRLFDLDVIWFDEKLKNISRQVLKHPSRKCLICQKDAKECGRSRQHSIEELQNKIYEMVSIGKEQ
ncbi:citrate lyase holo-[acyl-carrier protein] synthase [Candidatus Enterococcus lowellii]|nr:citrate lyase holo-[acyl-carrier protein] synthase [Enterococcus sp. DIV2402]MBO0463830.1 citrate lyase holo-[acyl-carrier protein] synthase [Enterococcus sp. DIV2402]